MPQKIFIYTPIYLLRIIIVTWNWLARDDWALQSQSRTHTHTNIETCCVHQIQSNTAHKHNDNLPLSSANNRTPSSLSKFSFALAIWSIFLFLCLLFLIQRCAFVQSFVFSIVCAVRSLTRSFFSLFSSHVSLARPLPFGRISFFLVHRANWNNWKKNLHKSMAAFHPISSRSRSMVSMTMSSEHRVI